MDLAGNPFFILGATLRDDRHRILQLAEEKSLLTETEGVREAASTLTNPRKRIGAELAWLPGLAPKRVAEAFSLLETNPNRLREQGTFPPLARANLLADGLVKAAGTLNVEDAAAWIVELAHAHDELDPTEITAMLNEERSVASFANISDVGLVETELQSRRQHYGRAIREALDKLPSTTLIKIVTRAVQLATEKGTKHAPILIDDLVDRFEVEAQGFLEAESGNISALVSQVRTAAKAKKDDSNINRIVAKLESVVRNWDTVAQPIQVSARSRGLDQDSSLRVASELRELSVGLFNEYGLLELSKRLVALQQEVFAEIEGVVELSTEDESALKAIAEQRARFVSEITYEADIGLMFKEKLRISPEGVEWKGNRFPLSEITRVRWGGTSHSVNGIPTGTTYSVFIGTDQTSTNIALRKQQVFADFVGRLWQAVGTKLLAEMLQGLSEGKRYRFGTAMVSDDGVELERRHLFSANDRVPCKWTDIVISNRAGTFHIAKKDEEKVSADLSYQEVDNVHVLEAAMRVFWTKATNRMSDLLKQTN